MTEKETPEENRFTHRTKLWLTGQEGFFYPLRDAAERAKKHLDTKKDREEYLAEQIETLLSELVEQTRHAAGPYLGPAGLGLLSELLTLATEEVDARAIARGILEDGESTEDEDIARCPHTNKKPRQSGGAGAWTCKDCGKYGEDE